MNVRNFVVFVLCFFFVCCQSIGEENKLDKYEINSILFQILNTKYLEINTFKKNNDETKLLKPALYLNEQCVLITQDKKSMTINLKEFFETKSDLSFYKSPELIDEILKKEFDNNLKLVDFLNIEKIIVESDDWLKVILIKNDYLIFTFYFSPIANHWILEKLIIRQKFSDEKPEPIYFQ